MRERERECARQTHTHIRRGKNISISLAVVDICWHKDLSPTRKKWNFLNIVYSNHSH